MDVYALFSDQTAEKVLIDSFPTRETEKGLVLKTTISSAELKESATASINNAYLMLEKLFVDIPESVGICVYGFSSGVTGNSADLAFAAAFLVHIAKKGIIKSAAPLPCSIAATGVITERLTIERVGNIREKLLAAAEKKVDALFYPYENMNEIDKLKKNDVEFAVITGKINLIPVKSMEDVFYELGFLKSTDTSEKKPDVRKRVIVLLSAAFAALSVIVLVSAFNPGILNRINTAVPFSATSDHTAFTKDRPTPGYIMSTFIKKAAESTSYAGLAQKNDRIPTASVSYTPGNPTDISQKPGQGEKGKVGSSTSKPDGAASLGTEIPHAQGNIKANLMNRGFTASQDDWVYFADPINVGIYRMKNDGSGMCRIQNAFATYINISGNSIYYVDTRIRGLFAAKADGSGKRKINDDDFGMTSISGDWVYYLNKSDNRLYKLKKNGLDRTPLLNEFRTDSEDLSNSGISCLNMCVEDNSVYFYAEFANANKENGIYCMDGDGSKKRIIYKDKCEMLCAEDGYIYYVSSGRGLYSIREDGTSRKKIYDGVKTFNLSSGLIYFATDEGIFKMNYSGDFISKLSNDTTDKINIAADWIYYFNSNDSNRLCRIRSNGADKQYVGEQ